MAIRGNILVIDDEDSIRAGCVEALTVEGYRVRAAPDGKAGLELWREESFDAVLLDLKMPRLTGMQVLERLHEESPETVVIVITGYASIESAVEAMRHGAFDYLPKPFSPEMLAAVINRALERRRLLLENMCLKLALKETCGPDKLVGDSPPMQAVVKLIQKVAPSDATVLVIGETGSGKELVARALHLHSHRRDRSFVAVDCGALVDTLFESELFGHVRGAFTGAVETTVGKIERADGGTLFLDEIGNIGLDAQAKLLRVIQEREVTKVGSTRRTHVDVRLVAATNRDLLREVREGRFREDLFYRLSVVPIMLPPLRQRPGDVRALAEHFLRKYSARRKGIEGFSEEALALLERYEWPGNVRELENTVERAMVLAEGKLIDPSDLFFYGPTTAGALYPSGTGQLAEASSVSYLAAAGEGHLAVVERREIVAALEQHGWQMARAADYLGIHRKTLREKIRRYNIVPPPDTDHT